jgi:hypothetical protein
MRYSVLDVFVGHPPMGVKQSSVSTSFLGHRPPAVPRHIAYRDRVSPRIRFLEVFESHECEVEGDPTTRRRGHEQTLLG